jgi:hypothetical protein
MFMGFRYCRSEAFVAEASYMRICMCRQQVAYRNVCRGVLVEQLVALVTDTI